MLHEVGAQQDLGPFECSPQAAEAVKARHGDGVEILNNDGATAMARVRYRVTIFIPKAMNTDFFVGVQIPTSWDAARYGIPPEVLAHTDPATLYVLVCVVEAFLSAGITEVYELYKYLHVSEVGNCIGSSAGGGTAAELFMKQRLLGKEVRSDILAETFAGQQPPGLTCCCSRRLALLGQPLAHAPRQSSRSIQLASLLQADDPRCA